MPLMWMSSLLMIFLLILVFMILYYEKISSSINMKLKSDFNTHEFMKW